MVNTHRVTTVMQNVKGQVVQGQRYIWRPNEASFSTPLGPVAFLVLVWFLHQLGPIFSAAKMLISAAGFVIFRGVPRRGKMLTSVV